MYFTVTNTNNESSFIVGNKVLSYLNRKQLLQALFMYLACFLGNFSLTFFWMRQKLLNEQVTWLNFNPYTRVCCTCYAYLKKKFLYHFQERPSYFHSYVHKALQLYPREKKFFNRTSSAVQSDKLPTYAAATRMEPHK